MGNPGSMKPFVAYLLLLFLLGIPAVFMSTDAGANYLSVTILASGLIAAFFYRRFHGGRFRDMGFRLNRNALIGMAIALVFTGAVVVYVFLLPYWLGAAEFVRNDDSYVTDIGLSPTVAIVMLLVLGGASLFVGCIFGEELAFRGYVLPRLAERYGSAKGVVLCSAIFGLWHLPAYYSVYRGGAAEEGIGAVALMLLVHAVSVVPLCILYLTTRELYGVSFYHAFANAVQYLIIANEAMGAAAADAVYKMKVTNELVVGALGYSWQVVGILLMLGLCALARRWTLKQEAPEILAQPDLAPTSSVQDSSSPLP